MLLAQYALALHGKAIGDRALEERNDKTKTQLVKLNRGKLSVRCIEMKQDLEQFGGELLSYGVTGEMVGELIPMLLSFDSVNNSTRQAIIQRKGITKSVYELEHEIDLLLRENMDKLILVFKKSQPAFFELFRNARLVIDYGSHHSGAPEPDDGLAV